MLEHLGHFVKSNDWFGIDEEGVFNATCRDSNCLQQFALRRGMNNGHIYWTTTNGNHSFSFFEEEEYTIVRNDVLLMANVQMFCSRKK
jgi:hypothetical protein